MTCATEVECLVSNAKKKKRKLPSWMRSIEDGETSKDLKLSNAESLQQSIEEKMPYLTFDGQILYSYDKGDCSLLCMEIEKSIAKDKIVTCGFDMEWPVWFGKPGKTDITALVQLCFSKERCYLFHLACMQGFPKLLRTIMHHPNIRFSGVCIGNDINKLCRDYGSLEKEKIKNVADLGHKANEVLRSKEFWSLDGLTRHLLQKRLKKDSVRISNWSQYPLTEQQKHYAATDAYASLLLYEELEHCSEKS